MKNLAELNKMYEICSKGTIAPDLMICSGSLLINNGKIFDSIGNWIQPNASYYVTKDRIWLVE